MALARSLLFFAIFYPGTLLYVLAGLAVSTIGTPPLRAVVHGWSHFHHLLARYVLGISTRMEGAIPPGPHLIAIKHQSMFETVESLGLARTPVVVMKRQLTDMPLFGWVTLRYGAIGVDRDAGASALRAMLTAAKAAVASGRPVVIFPEGTRIAPGEQPPLRAGFAGLYRALGLPVVPVAVDSGRLWGRGLIKHSGTITYRVGETIPAGLKRNDVEARVHAAINVLDKQSS